MIARLLMLIAVALLLAILAIVFANDPTCSGGATALPWLRDMQSQMCGSGE